MNLYKAVVTRVSIPDNNGETQRKIYVAPETKGDWSYYEKPAQPPSSLPTSELGSGILSYPEPGQHCIVVEHAGERYILAYTHPRTHTPYGSLIPEELEAGETLFTAAGFKSTSLRLSPKGFATLSADLFAQLKVNGTTGTVTLKSKSLQLEYFGGKSHYIFDKEDKSTSALQLFTRYRDNPGFSDHTLAIEEGYGRLLPPNPAPYKYIDKVLIKSGFIADRSHVYELDTRQSIKATQNQDKTVVTNFLLGYQTAHQRYSGNNYAEGSMIELSAKKNFSNNVGNFKFRYGRLATNNPSSQDKGEIFSLSVFEGLNKNKPFGAPLTDPMGQGKGWGIKYSKDSDQAFVQSFGRAGFSGDLKDSLTRLWASDKKNELSVLDVVGGTNIFSRQVFRQGVGIKTVFNEDGYYRDINLPNVTYKQELREKGEFVQSTETNSNKFEHSFTSDGYTVQYQERGRTEEIKLSNEKVKIETSKGVVFHLDGDDIVLKTGTSTFKITPSGLTFNGKALVFEDIINVLTGGTPWTTGGSPASLELATPAILALLKNPKLKTKI